jgi:hypothetical protein
MTKTHAAKTYWVHVKCAYCSFLDSHTSSLIELDRWLILVISSTRC